MMDLARKRIVVTGGEGFLGRHVVKALRARGCAGIIVPRRNEYDLIREVAVERLCRDTRPEVVIHLAAIVGGIGANQANPGRFAYANLVMGAMLMEHSRQVGVEKFVGVGTICSYPKFARVPFKEEDLWDGYPEETNAPYGLAKKMLLVQGQSYRQQYDFNAIHLLPVNLYGAGDNFDRHTSHVIPALIRRCLEARERGESKIVCWGDGTPTREFLYVEDCAEAILLATERYDGAEPVNVGSGFEISIKELVESIAELTGFRGEIVWDSSKPNGQPRRRVDTSRASDLFGFKATTEFREGLRRTVSWYREVGCQAVRV
jgi:GDP-L-fucose synthase